jgi:hypothetical protein
LSSFELLVEGAVMIVKHESPRHVDREESKSLDESEGQQGRAREGGCVASRGIQSSDVKSGKLENTVQFILHYQ